MFIWSDTPAIFFKMEATNQEMQDFIMGFNDGYTVSKFLPELGECLSGLKASSPRIEGIKAGIEEYTLERSLENRPLFLNPDRLKSAFEDKTQTKDFDKDH